MGRAIRRWDHEAWERALVEKTAELRNLRLEARDDLTQHQYRVRAKESEILFLMDLEPKLYEGD